MGLGKSIYNLTNLFTIYRWNNRPALLRFTEADNVFHSLLLELIAIEFLNKKGKNLSISNNIKAKIFKELPKIILSDVSLDTKKRILKKDEKIWEKVLQKSYNELKENKIMQFFEADYDRNFEGYANFIDLMVSLKEIEINSRIFPEYFEAPKQETEKKLRDLRLKLPYINDLENILNYVLKTSTRMTTMYRWNKNYRNIKSSVSSHTFMVISSSIIFYYLNNNKDKQLLDEIIIASVLHDFPEAFTGDVITPTKKKVEGLENIISNIEEEMIDEWLIGDEDTEEIFNRFKHYMINPFEGEYGRYVRTSDLFNAMLECAIEIKAGNSQILFREAFFSMKKELKKFEFDFIYELIDEIEKITFFN
ncbi:putative hydrolases of HD superfamily [Marinitoga hydrogenitolerans DSM 16785]|uniref:Hydrolases of HD superfamily n=1 Tax=Marinitoga hydrogenitolerans (strain DSM 16785 / JCM 12826 / AT1271) TaxID=1122195 RepID=A0A1M4S8D6_MARH1|nr:YfbR-like 5'-deoxynucleotidase [Marinitoga hydrogenitolerans]SHE28474.1 putative hydrolases of HD superfamily [Marinitoga hydrogenitolerans DSM 16785]